MPMAELFTLVNASPVSADPAAAATSVITLVTDRV